MSHNITVEGGKNVRLPTKGKYCDRDIVVTAQGVALPELDNPGTASDLMEGKQLLDGAGKAVEGTFTITPELTEQGSLIAQVKAALQGKAAGGSGLPTQEKAVEITENGTVEVLPDDGYTLSKVTVNVNVTEPDPLADFQRVEYITSDGEAYTLTDFIADNTCGIEMVVSFPHFADHTWSGSREDSGSTRFFAPYAYSASIWYAGFNGNVKISASTQVETIYRCQANFLNSRLATVYDEAGILKGSASISDTLTEHTYPICIFTQNYMGTPRTPRVFNLYSARCSKGYDVVREYIPCYRKSNGVIGLYEKFTGTFWTTPVGAFTKGPDIDWEVAA